MYYDIYLNDEKIATVGPSSLEHLNISLFLTDDDNRPLLLANGLTAKKKEGHQAHLTWLNNEIKETDEIKVVPSSQTEASEVLQDRSLNRGRRATQDDRFCDFCGQPEEEVGPVIQAGDSPFICAHCAELCQEIFKGLSDEKA